MTANKLCTVAEVSEKLGVSKSCAYDLIRRNILPAIHLGHRIRIDPIELEKFLRRGGTKTTLSPVPRQ